MDDLLEKEDKSKSKGKKNALENLSLGNNKPKVDHSDFFDDSPSIAFNQTKQVSPPKPANTLAKTTNLKESHDEIINEDNFPSTNFGKTQQTIINQSKAEEGFVSSRNMKPPLRRKDSASNIGQSANPVGLTIYEDAAESNKNESDMMKVPKFGPRRSSIEQKNDQPQTQSLFLSDFQTSTPIP